MRSERLSAARQAESWRAEYHDERKKQREMVGSPSSKDRRGTTV